MGKWEITGKGTKTREMARPTRTADPVTKKRKRNSSPHDKPLKVHRSSQHKSLLADSTLPQLQAHNILDVLEKFVSLFITLLSSSHTQSPGQTLKVFLIASFLSQTNLSPCVPSLQTLNSILSEFSEYVQSFNTLTHSLTFIILF